MRIPTSKIYRAFSELDQFTDAQCERLMTRVRLDSRYHGSLAMAWMTAGVGTLFAMITLNARLDLWALHRGYAPLDFLLPLMLLLIPAPAAAMLTRDLVLRHVLLKAIRIQLERVICPPCGYSLLGLVADNGMVTCPECGKTTALESRGLTAADLIPPESNEAFLDDVAVPGAAVQQAESTAGTPESAIAKAAAARRAKRDMHV